MSFEPKIRVQIGDFDVAAEYAEALARLKSAEQGANGSAACGAIATFIGLVRDQIDGPALSELFLEHYPGMTEQSMADLVGQATQRWPLLDVVVIHRVGSLKADDQIVYVQVASSHRAAAFAACEFIMDYLKTAAVFWKRETNATGAQKWVESNTADYERVATWEADGMSDGAVNEPIRGTISRNKS